jgi:nucleoside-diphosphate-sugar epimerase
MTHLFCFGFGYSAARLAARLSSQDWLVTGTSTSADGSARIASLGYGAALFDGRDASPAVAEALRSATHVVVSAPPDAAGDPVLRHHRHDLAASNVAWIGYLSTIGVYGDCGGAWVDETSPAKPTSERSIRRLAAEQAWLQLAAETGKRVELFRLAGIYGPGRSAIDNVRDGSARRIIKPGQVFNRTHVDDIATVLEAAIAQPHRFDTYNVTDDEPGPPQDVVAFAAELLGMPVPPDIPYEAANLSPMGRSFYDENKRVRNDRIKSALGVTLRYPTYREGLRGVLAETFKV